jgi:hypothetical protein
MYLILVFGCTSQLPQTIGKPRQILVLSNYQAMIEKDLHYILERPIYTVQPEPEFLLRYGSLSTFENYYRSPLIFIVGVINEEPISSIVQAYKDKIFSDTFKLYALSDLWARNQKVLVLVVSDQRYLSLAIKRYELRIRKFFREHLVAYMQELTYQRGYNKKLSEFLHHKYQFTIKLPYSFKLNSKYQEKNFLYFVAHNPERSIFIYWAPLKISLEPENIITLRDSLTEIFYDGDYIYQELTYAETTNFNNRLAIKLTGVWQNPQYTAGGPFITYAFYADTLLYLVDGMVYNPGQKKLNYLIQLEAILETFQK